MNAMTNHSYGSNGAHCSPSWNDAWAFADRCDAVDSYDEDTHEIEWCDGSKSTPPNPQAAINDMYAMSQS